MSRPTLTRSVDTSWSTSANASVRRATRISNRSSRCFRRWALSSTNTFFSSSRTPAISQRRPKRDTPPSSKSRSFSLSLSRLCLSLSLFVNLCGCVLSLLSFSLCIRMCVCAFLRALRVHIPGTAYTNGCMYTGPSRHSCITCMYPPPHMTCTYPPPHMTCMCTGPSRHSCRQDHARQLCQRGRAQRVPQEVLP